MEARRNARWDGTRVLLALSLFLFLASSGLTAAVILVIVTGGHWSLGIDAWQPVGALFAIVFGLPITAASAFAAVRVADLGYSITDTSERRERLRELRELAQTSEQYFAQTIDCLRAMSNIADAFIVTFEQASKDRIESLYYSKQKKAKFPFHAYSGSIVGQAPGLYVQPGRSALQALLNDGAEAQQSFARALRRIHANKIGRRGFELAGRRLTPENASMLVRAGTRISSQDPALNALIAEAQVYAKIPLMCDEIDLASNAVRARGFEEFLEDCCEYYLVVKRALRRERAGARGFLSEVGLDDFDPTERSRLTLLMTGYLLYRHVVVSGAPFGQMRTHVNLGALFIVDIWRTLPTPLERRLALEEFARALDPRAFKTFFADDPDVWGRMLPEEFENEALAVRLDMAVSAAASADAARFLGTCVQRTWMDFRREFGRSINRIQENNQGRPMQRAGMTA